MGGGLALVIAAVILAPWPTPDPEVRVSTFDPALMTVDPRGFLSQPGTIQVGLRELVLAAPPGSQPTTHVLTTPVPFTAAFTVSVLRHAGMGFPFQAKVWNPRTEVAFEAWYVPDGTIMSGFRRGDRWLDVWRLGQFGPGEVLDWSIAVEQDRSTFRVERTGKSAVSEVNRDRFPDLFAQETLSLTLYATAPGRAASTTIVRDPLMVVPRQTRYGTTVNSRLFRPLVLGVALWTSVWLLASVRSLRLPRWSIRDFISVVALVAMTCAAGWAFSRTPGHPFDMRNASVWTHIAAREGPQEIVGRSLIATEGQAHGGQPYASVTFPYPPLLTYLFWVLGALPATLAFEQTFKLAAVAGVAALGVSLLLLMRRLGVPPLGAALAAGAVALNPGVILDAAVWGQTDVFVALFLVGAAGGVVIASPTLLWTGAILASLTKQTGGLIAFIIVVLGLARFGARQNARGLLTAVGIVFLLLAPGLLSGIHPSAVYRPMLAGLQAFARADPTVVSNAVVSQSPFTLWSTLTAVEGAKGWERLAFSDLLVSPVGLTYFSLSRIAFGIFTFLLGVLIYRRRSAGAGFSFVVMATYALGAVLLLTRVSPRYFFFAVPFAGAALPWLPRRWGILTLIMLTLTMSVSMLSLLVFTSIWYPGLLPTFDPAHWGPAGLLAALMGNDLAVTLGGLLNLGVLGLLLRAAWKTPESATPLRGRG